MGAVMVATRKRVLHVPLAVCEELRSPVCMYRALAERTDDGSAEARDRSGC